MTEDNKGFTIVELLIVVVVIAILAAITIVAYNGVRSRAVESTLKIDAENASKLLANDLTTTGSYPAAGAQANSGKGLPTSNGNTYNYTPNNGSNPAGYSLTYSNPSSKNSYIVTNLNSVPTPVIGAAPVVTYPTSARIATTDNCGQTFYNFDLNSTATGSPTPTVQWQRMTTKNTTSGAWADITGGTTSYYSYYDNTMIEGDFRLFRAVFTSGSFTTISPTTQLTLTYGC